MGIIQSCPFCKSSCLNSLSLIIVECGCGWRLSLEDKQALSFYIGNKVEGLTLDEVWGYDANTMEDKHDYIQWMFPNDEPSQFNPNAPLLSDEECRIFKASPALLCCAINSVGKFMNFLRSNMHLWIQPFNHNHLRITRMLKFLMLIGLETEAEARLEELRLISETYSETDLSVSMNYWTNACDKRVR